SSDLFLCRLQVSQCIRFKLGHRCEIKFAHNANHIVRLFPKPAIQQFIVESICDNFARACFPRIRDYYELRHQNSRADLHSIENNGTKPSPVLAGSIWHWIGHLIIRCEHKMEQDPRKVPVDTRTEHGTISLYEFLSAFVQNSSPCRFTLGVGVLIRCEPEIINTVEQS